MNSSKSFNKKFLIPIPISLFAVIIYFNFIKKPDYFYVGTIEATKTDISSRISSVISTFPAKEGHKVKKDELLVEMACEDIKQNFDFSSKDFDRGSRLYKMGSLAQESFDHLKNKKDEFSLKLDWCSIKAGSNSTILNTYKEVGEYVTPGTKLLTLVNLAEVWTIIYVPQTILAKISLGMKVTGFLPELNMKTFEGNIASISDSAEFTPKNVQTREERTRLVFGVKIVFSNLEGLLKPGMSLEVKLE